MPPRKRKYELNVDAAAKKNLQDLLGKEVNLRTYKGVVEYLEAITNAHRLEVIPKEVLTAGVYAGGVLLQAIKLAKEEGEYTDNLPVDMQQGTLEINADRQEMTALLTAGNSGVQIRLLKKHQQQGKIITVEATEIQAPDTVQEQTLSITDKARDLINLGRELDDNDLFAE